MVKLPLPLPGSPEYTAAIKKGLMPSLATRSITGDYLAHVRMLLEMAAKEPETSTTRKDQHNRSTQYAIPAYICAAASIEVFVNELFLSNGVMSVLKVPDHWDLLEDVVERFQPGKKLVILPKLFLGKTLEKGKHPHQDAQILFTLRNCLVHYKFKIYEGKYENAVKTLADRKVALPLSVSGTPLVDRVSTVNGIRWAYNTAVATIKTLIAMLSDDGHIKGAYEAIYAQTKEISEEDMKAMALLQPPSN